MKPLALIALLCGLAFVCHADSISYSYSVRNAPENIGSFSWDLVLDSFIEPGIPADATYDSQGTCINCNTDLFTSFASESAPSNGDGCVITALYAAPGYSFTTYFAPVCDGLYDAETGGVTPQPGDFGTWTWTGTNPNGTQSVTTLTVSDPAETPEPVTWRLLLCGLGLAWLASKVRF